MSVLSTSELERRIANLEAENRELRQAAAKMAISPQNNLAEKAGLSELQKDAANLLFALHDAWPYVHGHCTIESVKSRIIELIRKHGDFYDLVKPALNEVTELVELLNRIAQESSRLPTNLDDEIHAALKKYTGGTVKLNAN